MSPFQKRLSAEYGDYNGDNHNHNHYDDDDDLPDDNHNNQQSELLRRNAVVLATIGTRFATPHEGPVVLYRATARRYVYGPDYHSASASQPPQQQQPPQQAGVRYKPLTRQDLVAVMEQEYRVRNVPVEVGEYLYCTETDASQTEQLLARTLSLAALCRLPAEIALELVSLVVVCGCHG